MKRTGKDIFFDFVTLLFRYNLVVFFGFLLARIIEYSTLFFLTSLPSGSLWLECKGVVDDITALSYFDLVLFLPALLIYFLKASIGKWFLRIIFILLLTIHFVLIGYFASTFILLDHALYKYSLADIEYILDFSGISLKIALPGFLVLIALLNFLFSRSERISRPRFLIPVFLPLILFFTLAHDLLIDLSVNGDMGKSMKVNKIFYFTDRTLNYFNRADRLVLSDEQLRTEAERYKTYHAGKEYIDERFPLVVKNASADVLGPFFNVNANKKPHFVFILFEGLARAFSGPDAQDASFTPFLDSLAGKGLYFPNFLSTAERTTNVLPSLFGSLPYAREGFTKSDADGKFPQHRSLIALLKTNGYFTSFHYGGWAHFTNYDGFLYRQGIDYITSNWSSRYKMNDADDKKFSWGYSDGDLYSKSLEDLDSLKPSGPCTDIYLTLSTHHPFHVPRQQEFLDKVDARMNELKLSDEKKKELSKSKDSYASVLYADDAIRELVKKLAARPGFENTIFIICGDHAMPETELRKGYLACYHIPLIIYSPMLKQSKVFPAVSSHLDIAPSLEAFLRVNYAFQMPDAVHWLGDGLDTFPQYRNIHSMAFIHNNSEICDYLYGNYFLTGTKLYDISTGFENEKEISDKKVMEEMSARLTNFKLINEYVCYSDKIWDEKFAGQTSTFQQEITLPAKTVFDLSDGKDSIAMVVEEYELDSSIKVLHVNYSFRYKAKGPQKGDPPLVTFRIRDAGGKICYSASIPFTLDDKSKQIEKDWIPMGGLFSKNLNEFAKKGGLRLEVLIQNKAHASFDLDAFKISALASHQ